jgi:flagellar motor switch/type III secretory pathway protein FliN
MARALDELDETVDEDASPSGETAGGGGAARSMALVEALTGIKLRVWAELGRTELGLSRALGLPLGSVVELDRPADAPIDLYVNGLRFAQGHLIVTDDGEWAFQCDTVGGRAIPEASSPEPPAADVFDAGLEAAEVVETEEAAEAEEAEPTDEPEDVIAAETPADTPEAPSTPNQEGAVD